MHDAYQVGRARSWEGKQQQTFRSRRANNATLFDYATRVVSRGSDELLSSSAQSVKSVKSIPKVSCIIKAALCIWKHHFSLELIRRKIRKWVVFPLTHKPPRPPLDSTPETLEILRRRIKSKKQKVFELFLRRNIFTNNKFLLLNQNRFSISLEGGKKSSRVSSGVGVKIALKFDYVFVALRLQKYVPSVVT